MPPTSLQFPFEVNAFVFAHLSSADDDFYTAAVVEFSLPMAPNVASSKPRSMIEGSLNEYLRLINEAAENGGADIVVLPEGCLNYNGIATREQLTKYAVELNDDDIHNSTSFDNVCDYSTKSSVRARARRVARREDIESSCLFKNVLVDSLENFF